MLLLDNDECATDENECDLKVSSCSNTDGSYECVCLEGYEMNEDRNVCEGRNIQT